MERQPIEYLLQRYQDSATAKQIFQFLQKKVPGRVRVSGSMGSLDAFLVSALFELMPKHFLIIANDKEDAAYFQNNLGSLVGHQKAHFFPDSFKRPQSFDVLNSNSVLFRTETVNQIAAGTSTKPQIIVTYPEALFEQVVAPSVLEEHRIEITVNEKLSADDVFEVLSEFGFNREEFVYEPGQFSIRGGIIDIFSYGNEYPYRIELFDDEVESMRTFNPTTQLSVEEIKEVSIVPNINTKFKREDKVSLLRILPKDTMVWMRDLNMLLEKLQQCFEKANNFADKVSLLDESELAEIFRDRAFIKPTDLIEDLEPLSMVCLSSHPQPIPFDLEVGFEAKPQPSFNKNFALLIEHLNQNTKQGIENFLFTDNPKQVERFYSIFEDLGANVSFQPVTKALNEGFLDVHQKIACYTDHQIFERFHRYRLRQGFSKDQAMTLKMLKELKPGDFVTHLDHGIGRFSGLEKIDINGHVQESVRLFYKNNDVLYVSINSLHKISKYSSQEGKIPKLSKLGSDAWKNLKSKTKRKVKDIAGELIKLYAKRKASEGFPYPQDGYLQNELEASFIYEDTPDQLKATNDVKDDMQKSYPMDRLICGDVGFGKTEIAVRAAFKAVVGGKQVAILVPTTILALQHNETFGNRLKEFGVTVDYINRFRSTKEKNIIFEKLKNGEIDIIIGTHGLLNKKTTFKDLGLLIIDEEQKFGVAAKEKLRKLKVNVDTLTLTATPIPRTLQFSLMAARDLSVIRTPPPNRQPIHTEVRPFNEELIKDSIYYEINRGGQVFFVHNRVKSLPEMTTMIKKLCPDINIASAHGKMDPKELEKTLLDFIGKAYDVLICTNIIETGLDIPNANTIIINDAHHFGLSDLHQLRGRVGRSNQKAFCYLFCPPMSTLTTEARKRLKTIEEFSDLGSGFNIAMRDLDIRGAGNMLGAEQSGFITDIGYQTYQKILEEAIQELKETEFKDLFKNELAENHQYVREVQIDTDVEMLIPDDYIENIPERLSLYTRLDGIETEEALLSFERTLNDRFGAVPKQVYELFDGLRLRWICKELGFERLILKRNKLRCYFIENPQSPFYETPGFNKLLQFISTSGAKEGLSIKQSTKHLIVIKDGVNSLKKARKALNFLLEQVHPERVTESAKTSDQVST